MERVFVKLDKNRSNTLDRDEMEFFVRLLWDLQGNNNSVVETFNKAFDEMDTNGDGHITKEEFIVGLPEVIRKAHVIKLHRQVTKRLRKRGASRKGKNISAQHIEALFDILDKDENRELDGPELNEIVKLLVPRYSCTGVRKANIGPDEPKRPLEFALDKLDVDKDTKIVKGEFGTNIAYVLDAICASNNSAPAPRSPNQTMAVACFAIGGRLSDPVKAKLWDAFDNDGDDNLTKDEIAPLVYYLWEHLGEDKDVIGVFKTLDRNRDGKITRDEFMGAADKAFAMAGAAWPRPAPAEIVASMRLYGTDLCMQGECCARICSDCAEDDAPAAGSAALFVAHGAIEALVAAVVVAQAKPEQERIPVDLVENCCHALGVLFERNQDKQDIVSRLVAKTPVPNGLQTLVQTLTLPESFGKFKLVLAAVRVLGEVTRQKVGLEALREQIDSETVKRVEEIAKAAVQEYKREKHQHPTEADLEAFKNSEKIEEAATGLEVGLHPPEALQ